MVVVVSPVVAAATVAVTAPLVPAAPVAVASWADSAVDVRMPGYQVRSSMFRGGRPCSLLSWSYASSTPATVRWMWRMAESDAPWNFPPVCRMITSGAPVSPTVSWLPSSSTRVTRSFSSLATALAATFSSPAGHASPGSGG